MNETVPEKDPWNALADELESITVDLRKLAGQPAPTFFSMDIHTHTPDRGADKPKSRAEVMAAVNAAAIALIGKPGETRKMSGGTFHHGAHGQRGEIRVDVYQSVADPALVDPDEEIARLRAENERLRAALPADPTGLAYTRADEDPQPSAGRVPAHHEDGVTGAVIEVANGHVVHECCGKLDDAPHENYCEHWRPEGGGLVDETEDERCGTCGESLREIESGTLGHIPGEACAPVEADGERA